MEIVDSICIPIVWIVRLFGDLWEVFSNLTIKAIEWTSPPFEFLIERTFAIFSTLSGGTTTRLLNTHGYFRSLILFLFLRPAYDQLDRMEDHVAWASEDVIEKCRQTYMGECNMSAIAGTIIAQVALTSLVLPNLSEAHWVARSAFLLSLVSGCLAVYYASLLQRNLGNFRTAEQVREWWRRPRSSAGALRYEWERSKPRWFLDDDTPQETSLEDKFQRTLYIMSRSMSGGEDKIKLQASVAAAILMSSPSMMINYALGAFLTGVGVYLGFVWRNNLDTLAGGLESRNVFICFLISLAFCYSFYVFPSLSKLLEDYRKSAGKKFRFAGTVRPLRQVIQRTGGLYELGRFNPEMLTDLFPLIEKFTKGVRLLNLWDDRSNREIIKLVDDLNAWLNERDLPQIHQVDELMRIRYEEEQAKRDRDRHISKESDKDEEESKKKGRDISDEVDIERAENSGP